MRKNKIITVADLKRIREENESIAFGTGCFDPLHSGHVGFFDQCRQFARTVVISVGSDAVLRKLKGGHQPFVPQANRAFLVSVVEGVDYVIIGGDEVGEDKIDFAHVVMDLKPNVFVLNDDDSAIDPKRALCKRFGIKLELVRRIPPTGIPAISSTDIRRSMS